MNKLLYKLKYLFFSGKNSKPTYYIAAYYRYYIPCVCSFLLSNKLKSIHERIDADYMEQRAKYYCKLSKHSPINSDAVPIDSLKIQGQKVYVFDTQRYTRFFNNNYKINLLPGDITYIPNVPSIVKSRPIHGDNSNSIILKLDRVRHFIFPHDHMKWQDKSDLILFRGKVDQKESRIRFMKMYFRHPSVDAGIVDNHTDNPVEWKTHKLTINDQLKYKFIMAIEGNDVASNLKWIMASNSIAVMPRPTYETWFMEGTLIPDYHYIEVKPDFSDLISKVTYYLNNPQKAEAIIENAHRYVKQFRNPKRENLISLMVLDRYFEYTNQK